MSDLVGTPEDRFSRRQSKFSRDRAQNWYIGLKLQEKLRCIQSAFFGKFF